MRRRLLLVLSWSATLSCSCGSGAQSEGDGCLLNSECRPGLVCSYRRCHVECDTDRDCSQALVCRVYSAPINVCLLEAEVRCTSGSDRDCPGALICGPDLICRNPCKTDDDCVPEQVCVEGACAERSELTPGGVLPVGDGGEPRCDYNTDCPAGLACVDTRCRIECRQTRDCRAGERCSAQGVCVFDGPGPISVPDGGVVPPGYGASCVVNSNCPADLRCLGGRCGYQCFEARDCEGAVGQCCASHVCTIGPACTVTPPDPDGGRPDAGARACLRDADCYDGRFCNGSELCVDYRCVYGRSPCDDGNPCTLESCDEQLDLCVSDGGLLGVDADHDGHLPASCGATGDDCDDQNPEVYVGARERCDFIDNNCNGQVDEALWASTTAVTLSGGDRYPISGGPPVVVSRGGGIFVVAASDTTFGGIDAWSVDPLSLSPATGPVRLMGSRTSWASCTVATGAFYGLRSAYPSLGAGGGALLAAGLSATYPTASCCSASIPPVATAELRAFSPTFATVLDAGTVFSGPVPGNGCNGGFSFYNRGVEPLSVTWSAAMGAYLLAWGDARVSSGEYLVYWTSFSPASGQLQMPRQVFQAGAGLAAAELSLNFTGPRALIAAGPSSVMVLWAQAPPIARLRYVLYDAQMTSIIAGPTELTLANPYAGALRPTHLEWDGQQFIALVDSSGGVPSMLMGFSALGARLFGPSPAATPAPGGQRAQIDSIPASGLSSLVLLGDAGIGVGVSQQSRLRFAWASRQRLDAGFLSVDYDTSVPFDARTDFSMTALSERKVLAVWADGNLREVVFECRD